MVKCVEVGDAGLNDLFKGLLSSGAVDGLVVPQKSGKSVIYTLIADPEKIKKTRFLLHRLLVLTLQIALESG